MSSVIFIIHSMKVLYCLFDLKFGYVAKSEFLTCKISWHLYSTRMCNECLSHCNGIVTETQCSCCHNTCRLLCVCGVAEAKRSFFTVCDQWNCSRWGTFWLVIPHCLSQTTVSNCQEISVCSVEKINDVWNSLSSARVAISGRNKHTPSLCMRRYPITLSEVLYIQSMTHTTSCVWNPCHLDYQNLGMPSPLMEGTVNYFVKGG